jgi:NTE family protein
VAFWTSLDWKALLRESLRHGLLRGGVQNPAACHARVDAGVDYAALLADPRPAGFIVVDLATGRVSLRGNRTERTADDLRRVAHASFALPPLLPPVNVRGQLLADGGLLQNAPLDAAVRLGASEIVYLCNVHVHPRHGFRPATLVGASLRYAEIFWRRAANVGFADAHITEGRYRGVPFLTIAPPRSASAGSLLSWMLPTTATMARLVRHGEMRAREALAVAGRVGDHVAPSRQPGPAFSHTGVGL